MIKRNIIISCIIALSAIWSVIFFDRPVSATTCQDYQTSIIAVPGCDESAPADKEVNGQDVVIGIVKIIIQIMTVSIGVVAVGAVIFGALLYGTSGDNPENVKKAKGIWMNVVIGLALFAFLVTITNFLIPGGVF